MAAEAFSNPKDLDDWFQAVPDLLHPGAWQCSNPSDVRLKRNRLWHRSCPWGGHLIKFELRNIYLPTAPERTEDLVVRPEVRSKYYESHPLKGSAVALKETTAPGEAVLVGRNSWAFLRLCSILFGDLGTAMHFYFFDPHQAVALHQKVRRNFPQEGDSACAFWEDDPGDQQGFLLMRPEEEKYHFQAIVVMRMPKPKFAGWALAEFEFFMEWAWRTAQWFFSRPGIQALRAMDARFYMVLSISSFKRGCPFLPSRNTSDVEIQTGDRVGCSYWRRYQPSGRFSFAEYLRIFLKELGLEIGTYETLDGCHLVPYECVVRRQEWEQVKAPFLEVYPIAKAAYRRANGGTAAPCIHEDVAPKYLPRFPKAPPKPAGTSPRLVVRKTFLDLDEGTLTRPAVRSNTLPAFLGRALSRA
mmetsp:Transcript_105997/g.252947  ORF Transcript_105997/g.252947 Transcript_105997/m.252947 type:complete len:414 (-) Transcript_105997:22-1263(-)|eukprot:CAMPEP_0181447006 /NCGR_PEP_ID=MMETSP1110-20121109/26400_1 /TAXON_ID=174948 /ORGANISM="Symbiodinium sp., Strain CCMP421" /LENGTH=413 /DNA_ID=CAMNT_0023571107 /DNA_START=53 /DNA_END=1294 /DNA_ORIENTATION=+